MSHSAPLRWVRNTLIALASASLAPLSGCVTAPPPGDDGEIEFTEAEVVAKAGGAFELVVRGFTPTPCFDVSLVPLVYITQPDYWGIQLIAEEQPGVCAQVVTPFEVRLTLDVAVGTKGVEVIGDTKTEKLDVPPP